MAINVSVYSNANNVTKIITFDFVGDVMVPSDWAVTPDPDIQYYFKITTNAKQDNNTAYHVKVVRSLGADAANGASLALNGAKQSRTNTANAYSTIRDMVVDYVYDYVKGHTADQYSSGCGPQNPMKFR